MNRPEARELLAAARVGRLATTRPDGAPHVVPITFAVTDGLLVTMIDHKPKSTRRLQRLANIEHEPRVSMIVDSYSEDWSELWWVRVDGTASIHHDDDSWTLARDSLATKYGQYANRPPQGPAIVVRIEDIRWWESTP